MGVAAKVGRPKTTSVVLVGGAGNWAKKGTDSPALMITSPVVHAHLPSVSLRT